MVTRPQSSANRLPRNVKAATLAASLVLSALLTALALRSPDQHWLAWISFLPLFVVVRSLRPPAAALAGGLWGACLYVFCIAGTAPPVDATVPAIAPTAAAIGPSSLFALLIIIPAAYVGLAARPARAIGFKLLLLALGWTLIEAVLHLHNPPGPHEGLLTTSPGGAWDVPWLARLLGYICTALLVACANASLVSILTGARLSFPAYRSLEGPLNAVGWHASQAIRAIESWTFHQAYPRAPPHRASGINTMSPTF